MCSLEVGGVIHERQRADPGLLGGAILALPASDSQRTRCYWRPSGHGRSCPGGLESLPEWCPSSYAPAGEVATLSEEKSFTPVMSPLGFA